MQERKHFRERQQLLDRIMSRDFPEYIIYDNEKRKSKIELDKSDKMARINL